MGRPGRTDMADPEGIALSSWQMRDAHKNAGQIGRILTPCRTPLPIAFREGVYRRDPTPRRDTVAAMGKLSDKVSINPLRV